MIYGFSGLSGGFGSLLVSSPLYMVRCTDVYGARRFLSVSHFSKAVREPSTIDSKHKIEEQILMFLCFVAHLTILSQKFCFSQWFHKPPREREAHDCLDCSHVLDKNLSFCYWSIMTFLERNCWSPFVRLIVFLHFGLVGVKKRRENQEMFLPVSLSSANQFPLLIVL